MVPIWFIENQILSSLRKHALAVSCEFGYIYRSKPEWKTLFLVQCWINDLMKDGVKEVPIDNQKVNWI